MIFSEEQQEAFNKYIEGKNVFITGPGGTGKSALVKSIYNHAQTNGKRIQVTALTGCAAILLECKAKTIHSWSGIGLGIGEQDAIITKIKKHFLKKKKWLSTEILIIDEVSMLSLKLFELLNEIGKQVRNNQRPFGGIQVIFCGDFYQLPPVSPRDEDSTDSSKFCFESPDWETTFSKINHIQLKKIFRQQDEKYAKILNQIREGRISTKSIQILQSHVNRSKVTDIFPTNMLPTRAKVDLINKTEMEKLTGEERTYNTSAVYDVPTKNKADQYTYRKKTKDEIDMEIQYLQSSLLCDKQIRLKVGSQVMCIINMRNSEEEDLLLCNGSQGIVTSFTSMGNPVVKFTNGYETVIFPNIWASENIPGIGVSQLPLILSWAITIHKAQGSTMDIAEIDVGSGIFEAGQTYVALSRIKSLDGLYLTSFDVSRITINRRVKNFYEKISSK